MNRGWRKFKQGRADYRQGRHRPETPPDDDALWRDHHRRWIGWMIEKSFDVQKIFDDLDRAGVRNTLEGDRAASRRVRELDRRLRFHVIK